MKKVFLVVLYILFLQHVKAQESMLGEVSYPYLDKLVETAKTNNPSLKMYDARIKSAHYSVNKAKLSYFDILTFSYLYNPNNTLTVVNSNSGILSNYQLGFFINVGNIMVKPAMVKIAKQEKAVAEFQRQNNELELIASVKERYYAYVQTQNLLRFKTRVQLDAEAMMGDMKKKFQRGEETLENYTQMLITYSNQTAEKINAEAAFLTAKSSLEELLGVKLEEVK